MRVCVRARAWRPLTGGGARHHQADTKQRLVGAEGVRAGRDGHGVEVPHTDRSGRRAAGVAHRHSQSELGSGRPPSLSQEAGKRGEWRGQLKNHLIDPLSHLIFGERDGEGGRTSWLCTITFVSSVVLSSSFAPRVDESWLFVSYVETTCLVAWTLASEPLAGYTRRRTPRERRRRR